MQRDFDVKKSVENFGQVIGSSHSNIPEGDSGGDLMIRVALGEPGGVEAALQRRSRRESTGFWLSSKAFKSS